jgi:iron complex transport system permease protein
MKRRLLLCGLLLILMAMVSMMTGTRFYSLAQVTNALFHADTTSTVVYW